MRNIEEATRVIATKDIGAEWMDQGVHPIGGEDLCQVGDMSWVVCILPNKTRRGEAATAVETVFGGAR